jgi:hypothetical protein
VIGARVWAAVAWAVAFLVIALVISATWLRATADADVLFALLEAGLALPVAAAVGALIVSRRPHNVIGWLLLVIALGWGAQQFGVAYTHHAMADGAPVDAAILWTAWLGDRGWVISFPAALILLPLLYPNGRPPSPRWRPVVGLAVVVTLLGPAHALVPGPLEIDGVIIGPNPAGIEVIGTIAPILEAVIGVVFVPLLISAVTAVVVRFRRSHGMERQQIKWLVAPFALIPVVLGLTMFPATETFGQGLGGLVLTAIFAAIGVAVLRYRLYDIDRVINRAVVYSGVTLVLVGLYLVLVLGSHALLSPLVAGSDLTVAASTLAVAAAFGPVRRRVQDVVDRRFDRSRYDAQRTIEAFGQRLRDEVELGLLADDLRVVTTATVRPCHVSLWLADEPRRSS